MKKLTAALTIVGILSLAVVAMPEHLCESSSHEDCQICQFLHNPPVFQAEELAVVNPIPELGGLTPLETPDIFSAPPLEYRISRAPPSL